MYKFTLALRYLFTRKIAYVSMLAIAVGLMAMIVVTSVMDGFQYKIRSSIYKIDGSLTLSVDRKARVSLGQDHFSYVEDRLQSLMQDKGGPIVALTPRVQQYAMINNGGYSRIDDRPVVLREMVTIIGINADKERRVLPLDDMLRAVKDPGLRVREVDNPEAENLFDYRPEGGGPQPIEDVIILGEVLANRLGVSRGRRVTVVSVLLDERRVSDLKPVTKTFIVGGCLRSGRYQYDRNLALCEGRALVDFLQLDSDCEEVVARLEDPETAHEVKAMLEKDPQQRMQPLVIRTWEDRMRDTAEALRFEKTMMLIVLTFIILVAGASIFGILYMVVLEKTRDIGILLAMGATPRGILGVFLLYGGALGLVGSGLGFLLGVQVTKSLNAILRQLEKILDVDLFPKSVYEFSEMPTHLDYTTAATYAGATFVCCLLFSALASLWAARLDPVKCLAYE